MSVGPIQLMAIGFEEFTPTGRILAALSAAVSSGAIRLVDLQFVSKDTSGKITSLEMSGLSAAEQIEFGSVIGALIGAGLAGEEGMEIGALEGALAAAEHSYGLTAGDVQDIADELEPGEAVGLLMIEHTWATDFRDEVAEAGGYMIAQGFLTPGTLMLIGAELQAQAEALEAIDEALEAIAISGTIEDEAMLEAAEAVVFSQAIQDEAARRAINALLAAELIEETAMEEAAEVVAAALELEEMAAQLAAGQED